MRSAASWIETLNGLPGLNLDEKARARVILLSKPSEVRELYLEGNYAEAAATIKALLRETPVRRLDASCSTSSLDSPPSSASLSSSASSSSASSSSSRRPSATEILVETATHVRHLSALPAAFRAAHFRASQPGDIYFRINVSKLPPNAAHDDDDNVILSSAGFELGEPCFAMVVGASSEARQDRSRGGSGDDVDGPAVIAIRIRSAAVGGPGRSSSSSNISNRCGGTNCPVEEFETQVVPHPRDTLEALTARLAAGSVRPSEVLWWRRSAGKWALWNGAPLRSWCTQL